MVQITNYEHVNEVNMENENRDSVIWIEWKDAGYYTFTTVREYNPNTRKSKRLYETHENEVEKLTEKYLKKGYRITSYGLEEWG